MLTESPRWLTLRKWVEWGAKRSKLELLATGAFLPILECVFVNLLTGAAEGHRWPYVLTLIVLGAFHAFLLLMQILPEGSYPIQCAADAVEAEAKVVQLQDELSRKAHACSMLRSAIDALNLQTCQINPTDKWAFFNGLRPVIEKITCDVRRSLGVANNEFTIELYCYEGVVSHTNHCGSHDGLRQEYFYSPMVMVDPCTPFRLRSHAAHQWGIRRGVAGKCRVSDDPNFFSENGKLVEGIYFRSFCTVPVHPVCNTSVVGILVLTSRQETPFASDVEETLQFVASLVSQYIESHNRCVTEWYERQAGRPDTGQGRGGPPS